MVREAMEGSTSDGSHTFDELYAHRASLFAAVCQSQPDRAWMSTQHHDGDMFAGYFIAGVDLPNPDGTGVLQVSYHMQREPWWALYVAAGVPMLDRAPAWDGHTPGDALERLQEAVLAQVFAPVIREVAW